MVLLVVPLVFKLKDLDTRGSQMVHSYKLNPHKLRKTTTISGVERQSKQMVLIC